MDKNLQLRAWLKVNYNELVDLLFNVASLCTVWHRVAEVIVNEKNCVESWNISAAEKTK